MKIYRKFRMKTYVDGSGFFEEIGEKLKIRKNEE